MRDPKPPTCPEHRGKYKAGCRACRAWGAWHARQQRKRKAKTRVPVGPVRAHVRALMKAGMRLKDIEARAGVSVQAFMYRPGQKGIGAELAEAVLAVTAPTRRVGPLRGRDLRDACGTRRRLRALARMGWPTHVVGQHAGLSAKAVQDVMSGLRRWVRPSTAVAVAQVYARLEVTVGPSLVAAALARSKGWAPPLAWDPDTIDDPAARPRGAVKPGAPVRSPRLSYAERVEAVRSAAAQGLPDHVIAQRVRIAVRTVLRIRAKHGIPPGVPRGGNRRAA